MMLDAFGIDPRDRSADAKRAQEGLDGSVAFAAFARNARSGLGQEYAPIASLHGETLGGQPPEHLGNRGLSHTEARGDIDLARLPSVLDQIGDQFDIILHELVPPRFACLPEAFRVRTGIRKQFLSHWLPVCGRHGGPYPS